MLTAVVSGSFHRHMEAITRAVHELAALSVRVLSPADPRVVAAQGEFLFVASDRVRSVRLVQDRHLESIGAANFLWVVCPDGYLGRSASMEIGYAAGARVPIFSMHQPTDLTLREYVTLVPSLGEAARLAETELPERSSGGFLVNPDTSVEAAHALLEKLKTILNDRRSSADPAARYYAHLSELRAIVGG